VYRRRGDQLGGHLPFAALIRARVVKNQFLSATRAVSAQSVRGTHQYSPYHHRCPSNRTACWKQAGDWTENWHYASTRTGGTKPAPYTCDRPKPWAELSGTSVLAVTHLRPSSIPLLAPDRHLWLGSSTGKLAQIAVITLRDSRTGDSRNRTSSPPEPHLLRSSSTHDRQQTCSTTALFDASTHLVQQDLCPCCLGLLQR